ncbi:MAG: acyltransferase family protein, partial [Mycobacteriaceae bacterium]
VFPLLQKLIRWTTGWHWWLLAVAMAVQLAETVWLQYGGASGVLAQYADAMMPTYLGYIVAGALAATHLARWQAWVRAHPGLIAAALLGTGVVALGTFAAQVHGPAGVVHAQAVLQPAMLPWSLAVAVALYALGSRWAHRHPSGRGLAAVAIGSHISFGVYLVHPLVMHLLAEHGVGPRLLPALPTTVLLWVLSVGVSVLAVLLVQRTVLSLPLTGRRHAARVVPVTA